ncbi:MAG: hypothetical protein NXI32_14715 [bacterium]|nr:hypothetical protein [bacterium]
MRDLNPVDNYLHGSWEALGNGAPMLVALAQLCSENWVRQPPPFNASQLQDLELMREQIGHLMPEARAILYAARQRGIIEIRAVNSAFDAAARLLAVYVEVSEEQTIAFRDPTKPAVTVRFLDGFRNLCTHGLVIHHIYGDFSLAPRALQLAEHLERDEVEELLQMATEFGLHD